MEKAAASSEFIDFDTLINVRIMHISVIISGKSDFLNHVD